MPFKAADRSQWGDHPSDGLSGSSHRRAWLQVAAAFAGLVLLASQLPSPQATLATALGSRPATGSLADAAMLAVASVAVWLLLVWVSVISAVAVAGRLPGAVGSAARAGLVALAPAAVRNVLLTVVGASVVTGLAGCATVGAAVPAGQAAEATVGTSLAVSAALASVTGTPDSAAGASGSSQLIAERLVGIATVRISDRIAVEGSAVRSAGAAPVDRGPAAPSLDWPATAASAPPASAPPASAKPSTSTAASRSAAGDPAGLPSVPAVSVDWPGPAARGAQAADSSVVVLRGDSLWTIAARSLPAGADDAAIDRTWRAWYAANTSVIGSNPNHLLPGQILVPPTPETGP